MKQVTRKEFLHMAMYGEGEITQCKNTKEIMSKVVELHVDV